MATKTAYTGTKPTYIIERDGHFFRAVNTKTGWRSVGAACAAMAGALIRQKAGSAAEAEAADYFLDNEPIAVARRRAAQPAPRPRRTIIQVQPEQTTRPDRAF
ncbi:hypothetical protein V5F32_05050 [Xanthobacter oligotrophicus]|uniref:Uncharacterized protein n=1 Tax=Xanthobacter oligotrophicus TaxID=2607286 RepID=A0ABW6ZTY9_9HYPH